MDHRTKVSTRGRRVPGVLPSSRFGEQVLSTGIPSLDGFIGGGVPVGGITLLYDTFPSRVANLILKSFIAEGATYNHHVYIASGKTAPSIFAQELPALKASSDESTDDLQNMNQFGKHNKVPTTSSSEEDLKIAWRYQQNDKNLDSIPQRLKSKAYVESKFDFTKKTSVDQLGGKNIHLSPAFEARHEGKCLDHVSPNTVLTEISPIFKNFVLEGKPSNVLRLCFAHCEEILDGCFMLYLKTLVRSTNSAAIISVGDLNISDEALAQCEHYCDLVIALKAITDDSHKSDLGNVDGLCTVAKLNSAYSFKTVEVPKELGFSFKKRKFYFHELHLPPEGEDTKQRETSNSLPTKQPLCGGAKHSNPLEF